MNINEIVTMRLGIGRALNDIDISRAVVMTLGVITCAKMEYSNSNSVKN